MKPSRQKPKRAVPANLHIDRAGTVIGNVEGNVTLLPAARFPANESIKEARLRYATALSEATVGVLPPGAGEVLPYYCSRELVKPGAMLKQDTASKKKSPGDLEVTQLPTISDTDLVATLAAGQSLRVGVIAPAGRGKSCLLRHLAHALAVKVKNDPADLRLPLPVLVRLRLKNQLLEGVPNMQALLSAGEEGDKLNLAILKEAQWVFLLDGLDELAPKMMNHLTEDTLRMPEFAKHAQVISSRQEGITGSVSNAQHFADWPLAGGSGPYRLDAWRAEQGVSFIKNYFATLNLPELAQGLLQQLGVADSTTEGEFPCTGTYSWLLEDPWLTTVLCQTQDPGKPPTSKQELFEKALGRQFHLRKETGRLSEEACIPLCAQLAMATAFGENKEEAGQVSEVQALNVIREFNSQPPPGVSVERLPRPEGGSFDAVFVLDALLSMSGLLCRSKEDSSRLEWVDQRMCNYLVAKSLANCRGWRQIRRCLLELQKNAPAQLPEVVEHLAWLLGAGKRVDSGNKHRDELPVAERQLRRLLRFARHHWQPYPGRIEHETERWKAQIASSLLPVLQQRLAADRNRRSPRQLVAYTRACMASVSEHLLKEDMLYLGSPARGNTTHRLDTSRREYDALARSLWAANPDVRFVLVRLHAGRNTPATVRDCLFAWLRVEHTGILRSLLADAWVHHWLWPPIRVVAGSAVWVVCLAAAVGTGIWASTLASILPARPNQLAAIGSTITFFGAWLALKTLLMRIQCFRLKRAEKIWEHKLSGATFDVAARFLGVVGARATVDEPGRMIPALESCLENETDLAPSQAKRIERNGESVIVEAGLPVWKTKATYRLIETLGPYAATDSMLLALARVACRCHGIEVMVWSIVHNMRHAALREVFVQQIRQLAFGEAPDVAMTLMDALAQSLPHRYQEDLCTIALDVLRGGGWNSRWQAIMTLNELLWRTNDPRIREALEAESSNTEKGPGIITFGQLAKRGSLWQQAAAALHRKDPDTRQFLCLMEACDPNGRSKFIELLRPQRGLLLASGQFRDGFATLVAKCANSFDDHMWIDNLLDLLTDLGSGVVSPTLVDAVALRLEHEIIRHHCDMSVFRFLNICQDSAPKMLEGHLKLRAELVRFSVWRSEHRQLLGRLKRCVDPALAEEPTWGPPRWVVCVNRVTTFLADKRQSIENGVDRHLTMVLAKWAILIAVVSFGLSCVLDAGVSIEGYRLPEGNPSDATAYLLLSYFGVLYALAAVLMSGLLRVPGRSQDSGARETAAQTRQT